MPYPAFRRRARKSSSANRKTSNIPTRKPLNTPIRKPSSTTRRLESVSTATAETANASEPSAVPVAESTASSDCDDPENIIMAIDQKGAKVGCAYYSVGNESLSLMEDVALPPVDCIESRK
jgi:hypothetical protein